MKKIMILSFIFVQTSIAIAGPTFNFACEDKEVYWTDNYTNTHFKVTGQLEQRSGEVFMLKYVSIMINANRGELVEQVSGQRILNNPRYRPRVHLNAIQFDIRPLNFKNIYGDTKMLLPKKADSKFYATFIMGGIHDHDGSSVSIECAKTL